MGFKSLVLFFLFSALCTCIVAQNTSVLILNNEEQENLRELRVTNSQVNQLCDSVFLLATQYMELSPQPLEKIYYEGRLETDTARIRTRKSLYDMDKVSTMFYASYGNPDAPYGNKIKDFALAWARTYQPDGNTINENKFVPLFWGYYLFRSSFNDAEQAEFEEWMTSIAQAQINRKSTPNNNWQAKRLRLIGLVGGITDNGEFIDFAIDNLKKYIGSAYYKDGTSNDLRQRDALHYHVGGLKILLTICVNLSAFDPSFDLFTYETHNGASIKKSVLYTLPYATGEKTHEEWVNSKVQLDKERAAAGIEEYQPGKLFNKNEAIPLFEFACYYNPDWYIVLDDQPPVSYTTTWIGLLNSPLVRD